MSTPQRPDELMPADLLDDERTWQGDLDPYLAQLAHEGRKHREPPPPRAPRLEGPADDGDPYLAQLVRLRAKPLIDL
jgi:hypothetical protein